MFWDPILRVSAGALLLLLLPALSPAEDWTRFRGPNGSGIAADEGYPAHPGAPGTLAWKSPVRPGKSSPILTARHVFLTAFDDGKLFTQCFDRASGKLLWERAEPRAAAGILHKLNEPASITPVTDGENVYVFFRDIGLFSYAPDGSLRWKTPLGPFTNSEGLSAAPIIANSSLILTVDQRVGGSWIAAFSLANGETLWKTSRPHEGGWATPLLRRTPAGDSEIVTVSARHFDGYSASTGKHSWSHPGLSPAVVASPVLSGNTVYAFSYGYEEDLPFEVALDRADTNKDGRIQASEINGDSWLHQIAWYKGDRDGTVTREEWDAAWQSIKSPSSLTAISLDGATPAAPARELWRYEKSFIGVVPSPLLYQDVLYIVKNGGILTSFDPQTGKVLKAGRLRDAIESYFASPVAASGRIYFVSEAGKLVVIEGGRDWKVLSVHPLDEESYATPALSRGRIFVRTAAHLYCFAAPAPPTSTR